MVGRVTVFSHWENWWKVKSAEGNGCEEGWFSLYPLSPRLALTGSGANDVLLPVHLQAEAVHHAIGQQSVDSQLQQQGQHGQQGLGPGCRPRQSCVGWEQRWRVYGLGAGAELDHLAGSRGKDGCLSGAGRDSQLGVLLRWLVLDLAPRCVSSRRALLLFCKTKMNPK